ncbi:Reverse transcriptase domain and Zinc finger,CCHC-type domain and Aspartic peptidase domain-containing protein [Strongyloides ratti]|uniref:Reverse transcriptase domain and Zinc finger,CCHC-type domain and Aspartic peptidase domain-containing protein n=1 Tax=Strongyloides ratti TaxID=34506 RepID=A0A090KT49_STRRB|nr:Reverse transcriptase domain and Zinc finger,CCHC-type domain and Aspartic peptidase domain-containing protein [Strongyloides ratti]CEF60586.1 Reverse transcriptase domain and Zinc finger,CCHC-type domain and Aspartic peptidase domain-containing protein [Strongyloides ratti]
MDNLVKDKYYHFIVDFEHFENSILAIERVAESALAKKEEYEKMQSIKDRLMCQMGSRLDLYDFIRDYKELTHMFFNDLVMKFKDGIRKKQLKEEANRKNGFKEKSKNIKCYHCQITGHVANKCIRKRQGMPQGDYSRKQIQIRENEVKRVKDDEEVFLTNSRVQGIRYPRICTPLFINGIKLNAILDGGSDINIINNKIVESIGLKVSNEIIEISTIAGVETVNKVEEPVMMQIRDKNRLTNERNLLYSEPTPNNYETGTFSLKTTKRQECNLILENFVEMSDHFKKELADNYGSIISKDAYDVGKGFGTARPQEYFPINPVPDYKIYSRNYPLPGEYETIQRMVKEGILIPTKTLEVCNHFLINKPNTSKKRLILDCRPINRATRKFWGENRRTTDLINSFRTLKYASCVDLKAGYYQINLAKEDIHKYNLKFMGQRFTFTKLPQGSMNAPIIYQQQMEDLLESLRLKIDNQKHSTLFIWMMY